MAYFERFFWSPWENLMFYGHRNALWTPEFWYPRLMLPWVQLPNLQCCNWAMFRAPETHVQPSMLTSLDSCLHFSWTGAAGSLNLGFAAQSHLCQEWQVNCMHDVHQSLLLPLQLQCWDCCQIPLQGTVWSEGSWSPTSGGQPAAHSDVHGNRDLGGQAKQWDIQRHSTCRECKGEEFPSHLEHVFRIFFFSEALKDPFIVGTGQTGSLGSEITPAPTCD